MVGKISLGIIFYLFLFGLQGLGASASERLWSDLSIVEQDEVLIRAVDLYGEDSVVPMVVSLVMHDPMSTNSPTNGTWFLRVPRLALAGFRPATVHMLSKKKTNTVNEVFLNVINFHEDRPVIMERGRFYRPQFPVGMGNENWKVLSFFHRIPADRLNGMIEGMMKKRSDSDRTMLENIEREHGVASLGEEIYAYDYDKAILFGVRDDSMSVQLRHRGIMVWLSKRELSEFVYGLCGEDDYVKLSTNSLLLPKSDVLPLETDIGKRLYFLKTYPDECDKIRSEIEKARTSKRGFAVTCDGRRARDMI